MFPASAAKPSPFARHLLRHRSFLAYVAQDSLSSTATAVASVCVIWYVYASTGSAAQVGIVALAESLATVGASLPAGTWVDRYNRRHLLVAAHLTRAGLFGLLAAVTLLAGFQLTPLVAIVLAWGAFSELRRSTSHAVLPDVVEHGDLADANGVDQAMTSTIQAVSSALGGGIIATVGVLFGFAYAALAYGVAAGATAVLLSFRVEVRDSLIQRASRKEGMLTSIHQGFRWLVGQRGLLQLSVSAMVFNFLFALAFTYLIVYVVRGLAASSVVFGGLLAVYAIGYVAGSLVMGRTRALQYAGRVWVLGYGGVGGGLLVLMGVAPNVVVALVASAVVGVALGFAVNAWLTSAQNLVPADLRGRYFAIDGVLSFVSGPPAIAVGAVMVTALGPIQTFLVAGIAMWASTLGFGLLRPLWSLDGRHPSVR